MPRTSRVVLPNYPHHIIQRGHNKQVVFASDEDYLYYLENLKEWVRGSIPEGEWGLIRKAVQRGQLTGSNRFAEDASMIIGRRIEFRGQGRPIK